MERLSVDNDRVMNLIVRALRVGFNFGGIIKDSKLYVQPLVQMHLVDGSGNGYELKMYLRDVRVYEIKSFTHSDGEWVPYEVLGFKVEK